MKVLTYSFRKRPNGYGYYKIMVDVRHNDGDIETIDHLTNDMALIDQINSDDQEEKQRGIQHAIDSILSHNLYNQWISE